MYETFYVAMFANPQILIFLETAVDRVERQLAILLTITLRKRVSEDEQT